MDRTAGERILACLKGIATGDAIGKQTETLSREGVLRWYPDGVRGFEGSPGTPIPRYSGNAKHEWRIGETELQAADVAAKYFPNGPLTIVPLALALGTVMPSAEAGILLATNIGGDSDSVASIAGAILGARYPIP
jgi:ADP-ribosylglycohydrolase